MWKQKLLSLGIEGCSHVAFLHYKLCRVSERMRSVKYGTPCLKDTFESLQIKAVSIHWEQIVFLLGLVFFFLMCEMNFYLFCLFFSLLPNIVGPLKCLESYLLLSIPFLSLCLPVPEHSQHTVAETPLGRHIWVVLLSLTGQMSVQSCRKWNWWVILLYTVK